MNNTMCLGLFLLVMHIQRLPWTYSSEVLVTVGESFPLYAPSQSRMIAAIRLSHRVHIIAFRMAVCCDPAQACATWHRAKAMLHLF